MRARHRSLLTASILLAASAAVAPAPARAQAVVPGLTGSAFTLTARADRISTPDGGSFLFWGFAAGGGQPQYPGPTLIVQEGATVTVSVTNDLPLAAGQRASLAFPGQTGVTAACTGGTCTQGAVTMEANAGSTVTYSFVAARPGTYLYSSASRPDLQAEMGLFGALIVRPTGFDAGTPDGRRAYASPDSAYDHEYLFLLSDIDSRIHDVVEAEGVAALDASGLLANPETNYWFINGRNAPDTMAEPGTSRLPTQPYNSMPRTHPGDRLLMRVIGAGRDLHPFHHHGNHARIIAIDGFPKQSAAGGPLDLSHEVFTIQSLPGQTVDAIFDWTGKDLGWDIYGTAAEFAHTCNGRSLDDDPPGSSGYDATTREYCPDHGKPLPVSLPDPLSLTFGGFWGGSPFLGTLALLPPGQGGLNPNAGYTYMWHSHTEKEITNNDVFPGGMMTMLVIEPIGVPIP